MNREQVKAMYAKQRKRLNLTQTGKSWNTANENTRSKRLRKVGIVLMPKYDSQIFQRYDQLNSYEQEQLKKLHRKERKV